MSQTNHKNYNFSEKSSVSVYSLRDSDHQKLNKLRFLKFKSELSCGNQSNTRLLSDIRDTCHMRLEPGAGEEDTVTMSHHSDEGSVMPGEDWKFILSSLLL